MKILPAGSVAGAVAVPGDKSVSHRAVMLGAIGAGETVVENFGRSADTEATVGAMRALGVEVIDEGDDGVRVRGRGLQGLRQPDRPVDCMNAGTLMRLLAGELRPIAGRIVWAWILTIPLSAALAALTWLILPHG